MTDVPLDIITAAAGAIAGGGTLALAWQTRKAVQASAREAAATVELAEETRTDRELNCRPLLVISAVGPGAPLPGAAPERFWCVAVTNIGAGPADRCELAVHRYPPAAAQRVSTWGILEPSFGLAAGGTPGDHPYLSVELNTPAGRRPMELWNDDDNGAEPPADTLLLAVRCRDMLGNFYRFRPGRDLDFSRRDNPAPPAWATWQFPDRG